MKTIEIYEKTETSKLQKMLITYENNLKKIELSLFSMESDNLYSIKEYEKLKNKIVDYEIDISIIRMELNKRLWKEK